MEPLRSVRMTNPLQGAIILAVRVVLELCLLAMHNFLLRGGRAGFPFKASGSFARAVPATYGDRVLPPMCMLTRDSLSLAWRCISMMMYIYKMSVLSFFLLCVLCCQDSQKRTKQNATFSSALDREVAIA